MQFSTARPSAITPTAKIATPSKTSYRAKANFDLENFRTRFAAMLGILECRGAGVLKISLPHFSVAPSFEWGSPGRILREFRLRRERRVVRRPCTGGTSELDSRWFARSRGPEYPFSRRFTQQCCGKRYPNPASLAEA